jgi:hypothetical protein
MVRDAVILVDTGVRTVLSSILRRHDSPKYHIPRARNLDIHSLVNPKLPQIYDLSEQSAQWNFGHDTEEGTDGWETPL